MLDSMMPMSVTTAVIVGLVLLLVVVVGFFVVFRVLGARAQDERNHPTGKRPGRDTKRPTPR